MQEAGIARAPALYARCLLACASFFNLALLPFWVNYRNDYLEPPPYSALLLAVGLAGAAATGVTLLLRKYWTSRPLQGLFLLLFAALPLEGVRNGLGFSLQGLSQIGLSADPQAHRLGMALALLILAAASLRWWAVLARLAASALLVLSPLLAFSAYLVLARDPAISERYVHYARGAPENAPAPLAPATKRRVYLLILDEADYGVMYGHRPAGLALPTFDRLARTSAFFTRAHAPGRDTVLSVPAMLLGQPVRSVTARGSRLGLTTASGQRIPDWMRAPHLLTSQQAQHRSVAVIGYYHPYCAGDGARYDYCSHWRVFPYRRWAFSVMPFTLAALQDHFLVKRMTSRYLPAAAANARQEHHRDFLEMTAELRRVTARHDLVYAHLNLPHPAPLPVAAIRHHGKLSRAEYLDHLRRVDAFLARFLHDVEAKDRSKPAIIITADHGLRVGSWAKIGYAVSELQGLVPEQGHSDLHVPFIVHFPHSRRGIRVDNPVSNVHVARLAMALADGTVGDEHAAASLLRALPHFDTVPVGPTFRP